MKTIDWSKLLVTLTSFGNTNNGGKFIRQKLNYMHKNLVSGKWKLVENYLDYQYSSARFYDLGEVPGCKLFHYADMRSAESPLKY